MENSITTLKARRKALGLSQAELAELIGVNLQTVWRWERGRIEPHRVTLRAWVAALEAEEARQATPETVRPPVDGSTAEAGDEQPVTPGQ